MAPPSVPDQNSNPGRSSGGQSKFNAVRSALIISKVQLGSYVGIAAESVGISRWTLNRWRQRGERELARASEFVDYPDVLVADIVDAIEDAGGTIADALRTPCVEPFQPEEWPFVLLMHLLKRARARVACEVVEGILRQGIKDKWTALAWYLERTHPEEYGRHRPYATADHPEEASSRDAAKAPTAEEVIERLREYREKVKYGA
ncbi:hypothetical protein [Cryobacterium zhongshanensis]|uniref:Uncharacterized protein n=1 Tax=Cryobacterium zhongshanensis TaxID=2928153 RepID=A0AA41QTZ2_9MICO|nr:hypothetical protein [Cryobacterium zhongshanensis]MCI4657138.1 hypothetical protein [Cryobacterium zhongshanensis]